MPRFFFPVYDHTSSPDRDGTELPNFETARTEAVHLTGGLLSDQGFGLAPVSPLCVEVADEQGVTVLRVEVGLIYPSRPAAPVPPRLETFLQ